MGIKACQLVAHRGYQKYFPENTMLAINEAINHGAVNIEIDIQLNDDGEVILFHDVDMYRATGRKGNIHTVSSSQLRKYFLSEPSRLGNQFSENPITFLRELLPLIKKSPQVNFFIEVKQESVERYGVEYCIKRLTALINIQLPNVIIISFSGDIAYAAHQLNFLCGLVIRDWAPREKLANTYCADYLFINEQCLPPNSDVSASVPVILYEITDTLLALEYLRHGAYAIETFDIAKLLK
ncbi:MAG: glycerophosphoryl diester phosphodiesterase [Candidatus Endobugula sp.]|jgi:glycerophosphoryl diester phosphodiesterase